METNQKERRKVARWTDEEDAELKQIVIDNPSTSMQEIANQATSKIDRAVPGILRRLRQLREEDSEVAAMLPAANRRQGRERSNSKPIVKPSAEPTGLAHSMVRMYLSGEAAETVEQQLDPVIRRHGELRAIQVLAEILLNLPGIIADEVKRRLR